ncbi:MAG: dihydroneopterin aldolase [Gemmatimonadota bacterium]
MHTNYEVALNGVSFHALIGVLPHERLLPQPVHVDVRVWPRTAPNNGDAGTLLDYRQLYDLVAGVVAAGPIDYLEGFALAVAERVMETDNANRVRVNVRKPHVPLPGPVENAEVSIELMR